MNRVYRLVFNRARRVWQVASELTQGQGARGTTATAVSPRRHPLALACLVALGAVVATSSLWAVSPVAAQTIDHATGGSGGSSNDGAGGDAGQSGIAGMDGTVGAGGAGGAAGAMGSPGTPGGDGGDGGAGHDDGGGGGGGGGGHGGTLTTSPSANMTGGNGGSGGAGDYFNDGGGGGGGGDGALITQTATVAIDTNITLQGGDGGPGNPGVGIGIGFGGAGGGGAGLYVSGSDTVADVTVAGIISGGDGGVSDIHGGGFGGDGGAGAGVVVTDGADLSLQLSSHIGGGIGGSGSYAGNSGDGVVSSVGSNVDITLDTGAEIVGGDGHGLGDGGAGLRLAGGGQVTNHGTIRGGNAGGSVTGGYFVVRGGQGSGGAAGGDGAARAAAAGAGIVGQNLTIINDGTIAGGARANAITFTGGANVLWLQDGSVINGIVDATAGSQDQLMLGDISSGSVVESTFDVDQLGPAGQFRGFEQYWAVGNSIVTLTGTTTEVTPWTIDSGAILSIAADASLGDASGDLLLRYGGVLQVTGVANETTARNIGIYQQGLIDIANADNNFTVTGAISDYEPPGSTGPQGAMLLKAGAGTLTLAGNNTYTGGTWVGGGTLDIAAGSSAGPLASAGAPSSGVIHLAGGTTLHNAGTISSVEYDGSLGQPADALQAVTVSNSGSIVGGGNGTGKIVALLNGDITNSGNISTTTPTVMGSGAVQLTGEGSIDNTGTISSTPQSRTVLLGSMLSTTLPITGGIELANRAGGVIEGGIGVAVNQMVALVSGGGGTTYANRPISITNDGGTIRGSLVGVELLTGGTIINRAGSTIEYTGTATDPCANFFSAGMPASGSCAIHAPDAAALGTPPGVTIAPTVLTNAGSIVGDVQLGDGLANDVTLVAGGSIDGDLDIGTSSDALLTLKGGAGTTQAWSQAVTGSTTFAGSLIKSGAGTWVLDNAALADVTGTTQLQAGSLIVGGSAGDSGELGGNVAVASAATLGGHGSIAGNVTVADGGHIAPGNSVGVLDVAGDLILNGGSILDFELGSPGSSADPASGVSDRIDVAGDLTLDGTLNLAQSTDSTDGTAGFGYYRLLTYSGTLTDNGLEVGTTPTIAGGGSFDIQAGSGNVDLFIASLGDDTLQHWQGGDGTWNATDTQWLNKNSTVPVTWAGNHAVFKNEPGGFNGGTVTVNGTQTFKGLQFVDNGYQLQGPGTLQIDGMDRTDGNAEIRVLAGTTAQIATSIAGSGGISKTQGGTLVLSGNNTYSGGTSINGGTLSVSSDANLGAATGTLTLNGGTLQNTAAFVLDHDLVLGVAGGMLQTDANLTVARAITGNGPLTQNGAGTLILQGNVITQGAQTYNGIVKSDNDIALISSGGDITQGNGGEFHSSGRASFDAGTGAILLSGANEFDGPVNLAGGNVRIDSAQSLVLGGVDAGTLTVTTNGGRLEQLSSMMVAGATVLDAGTGSIMLDDAGNDFQGAVMAAGADIMVSDANDLQISNLTSATGGNIDVASGGALFVMGAVDAGTGTIRLNAGEAGYISGSMTGMDVYLGTGNGTLLTGALSSTSSTTLMTGELQVGDGGTTGTLAGDVVNHSGLIFNRGDAVIFDGIISGSGSLMQQGGGTLILTGNSSYAGSTTIAAGTLQIGDGGSNGSVIGDITNAGTLVFDRSDTVSFAGVVSGSGSLVQQGGGTLILTGNHVYTGGTTIAAGMLQIGNGGSTGSIIGDVANAGTLAFDRSDAVSFDGVLSGNGTLVQQGSGTLTLNGASSTFTGSTQVQSGGLIIGGTTGNDAALGGDVTVAGGALLGGHGRIGGDVTLDGGAHLAPGASIGTLTIDGNLVLNAGSVLDFEFGAPGTDFTTFGSSDSVHVGGDLTLEGAILDVTDAGDMGPGLYNLFTWGGTLTESGDGLTLGTTPADTSLVIQTLAAQGQINLIDTTGVTLNVWNANGQAGAGRMGGGTGTWSATSAMWTDTRGTVSNAAMQPQPGFALFGGDAGTVTVDGSSGAVTVIGMQFVVDGYTLTGDTLTLVKNADDPVIRVGDGSSTGADMTVTIDASLAGTAGFTKTDLGTLVLANANTGLDGNVTVNGGMLKIAAGATPGSGTVTVDGQAVLGVPDRAVTLKVDPGASLGNHVVLKNGGQLDNAGSIVGTTQLSAVATGGSAGRIDNHDGGIISGSSFGALLFDGGTVVNTGTGSAIRAVGTDGWAVVIGTTAGSVTNAAGASIEGSQAGVVLGNGGTITNAGGASIRGGQSGVLLLEGGTIFNRADSIIATAGSQGGDCNDQGDCAILVSTVAPGYGGALTLRNAGAILGNVQTDSEAINVITLVSGGSIRGNLDIGGNAASTLTLDGDAGTSQLYSDAVTGATTFAGALTKAGEGTWVIDSNDLSKVAGTTIAAGTLQVGSGGTTGAIVGNVANSGTLAFDRSDDVTFDGVISGNGSLVQQGHGTLTLTGTHTYTGGTTIAAGTLQIGDGGTTGAIVGNVANSGTLAFDRSDDVTFDGVISGNGSLVQQGHGTLTLTGTNAYTGGTTIAAGTLQMGDGGTTGAIVGNVANSGTLAFDRSDDVTFDGVISGNGSLVQQGHGTLTLTGAHTYSGGTTVAAGTLVGDTGSLQGAIANQAKLVFMQAGNGTFDGILSGSGTLTKAGAGELILNGDNTAFTGATTVQAGALVVGGDGFPEAALGGTVTVAEGALLGGFGTVGGIDLSGTLATGHSIGTLHVAGDVTFQPGSTWQIEVHPDGQSDRLAVAGKVAIKGGSALALGPTGDWAPRTGYTILAATGGLDGQFDTVRANLAFLTPTLAYGAHDVTLSLQRNDIGFADVGTTRNQQAAAGAAEDLGWGNPVYDAVVRLDADQARNAFDQLSGEWYAGMQSARLHDSRYVREAMGQRLAAAAAGRDGASAARLGASAGTVWFQGWGQWGDRDGDGNAARMQANGSGLLVGVDADLGGHARIGGVLGASQSVIRLGGRVSDGHGKATWIGLYGSAATGPVQWQAGVAYARERLDSNRHLTVPGLAGSGGADLDGRTGQGWIEAALPHTTAHGRMAPFLNLAHVRVHTDGWREGGGATALQGGSSTAKANLAVLGVRGAWQLGSVRHPVRLHGSLGWRQAFGTDTPQARLSLAGSAPFTVYGLPLARHAVAVQAGLDFAVSDHVRFDVGYSGQFAGDARDQGARMTLQVDF